MPLQLGGGGSSTVHEGFPFLFTSFPKSQIFKQEEINGHQLSSAGDDDDDDDDGGDDTVKAMNQSEIKAGEPVGDSSLSGIECVGELSLRVFTK